MKAMAKDSDMALISIGVEISHFMKFSQIFHIL